MLAKIKARKWNYKTTSRFHYCCPLLYTITLSSMHMVALANICMILSDSENFLPPNILEQLGDTLSEGGRIFQCAAAGCSESSTLRATTAICDSVFQLKQLETVDALNLLNIAVIVVEKSKEIEPNCVDSSYVCPDKTQQHIPAAPLKLGQATSRLGEAFLCVKDVSGDNLTSVTTLISQSTQTIVASSVKNTQQCYHSLEIAINNLTDQLQKVCASL